MAVKCALRRKALEAGSTIIVSNGTTIAPAHAVTDAQGNFTVPLNPAQLNGENPFSHRHRCRK